MALTDRDQVSQTDTPDDDEPFAPARRGTSVPVADCDNYGETLLYGYNRHLRHGEKPCDRCRAANARYKRERRNGGPVVEPEDRPTIADDLAAGPLPNLTAAFVERLVLDDLMTGGVDVLGVLDVLADLTRKPAWMADGLCREPAYSDVSWFPERGGDSATPKAVCGRCAVRGECLDYALAGDDRHGIWGGTSERERRRLRREGQTAA